MFRGVRAHGLCYAKASWSLELVVLQEMKDIAAWRKLCHDIRSKLRRLDVHS